MIIHELHNDLKSMEPKEAENSSNILSALSFGVDKKRELNFSSYLEVQNITDLIEPAEQRGPSEAP